LKKLLAHFAITYIVILVLGGTAGRRNTRCGGLHFLWRELFIDEISSGAMMDAHLPP
jgi:hypothetical protein